MYYLHCVQCAECHVYTTEIHTLKSSSSFLFVWMKAIFKVNGVGLENLNASGSYHTQEEPVTLELIDYGVSCICGCGTEHSVSVWSCVFLDFRSLGVSGHHGINALNLNIGRGTVLCVHRQMGLLCSVLGFRSIPGLLFYRRSTVGVDWGKLWSVPPRTVPSFVGLQMMKSHPCDVSHLHPCVKYNSCVCFILGPCTFIYTSSVSW